jgi:hypothetical protein
MSARDDIHRLFESGRTSYRLDEYLDAHRAEVLREAADAVAKHAGSDLNTNAKMLRRMADEAEKDTADGEPAELVIYRAAYEHEQTPLGHYTTPAAARAHCETHVRRELPSVSLDWIEDEEDGVAELVAAVDEEEYPTGYVVTALTVASAYDEEADE